MNCKRVIIYSFVLAISTLVGCGDPPLLSTQLPNGYTMRSNGGSFANITRPNGLRMAEYFGIIDQGREQWCKGFAWREDYVICELEVSTNGGAYLQGGYFLFDTASGSVEILSSDVVEEKWKSATGTQFPTLLTRYRNTDAK